jgi:hypothetical protein
MTLPENIDLSKYCHECSWHEIIRNVEDNVKKGKKLGMKVLLDDTSLFKFGK